MKPASTPLKRTATDISPAATPPTNTSKDSQLRSGGITLAKATNILKSKVVQLRNDAQLMRYKSHLSSEK